MHVQDLTTSFQWRNMEKWAQPLSGRVQPIKRGACPRQTSDPLLSVQVGRNGAIIIITIMKQTIILMLILLTVTNNNSNHNSMGPGFPMAWASRRKAL